MLPMHQILHYDEKVIADPQHRGVKSCNTAQIQNQLNKDRKNQANAALQDLVLFYFANYILAIRIIDK